MANTCGRIKAFGSTLILEDFFPNIHFRKWAISEPFANILRKKSYQSSAVCFSPEKDQHEKNASGSAEYNDVNCLFVVNILHQH